MNGLHEEGTGKARKKGNYILLAIAALLAVVLAAAVVRFYPAWSSAGVLNREVDFSCFSYEMEIKLDKGQMDAGLQKQLGMIESLCGCEAGGMYQLRIRGSVWGDKVYVLIYPRGMQTPLVELYLSDKEDMVNEALFYNAVRENLVSQHGLLGIVLPEQKEELYMTLGQMEQMFGVDLSGARDFVLPELPELTRWQYFAMIAFLQGEKLEDGRTYSLSQEQTQVKIAVPGEEEAFPLYIDISVLDPKALAGDLDSSKLAGLLPDMGIEIEPEQLEAMESFRILFFWGEPQEIVMPKALVNQDTVELIEGIREFIQKFTGDGN